VYQAVTTSLEQNQNQIPTVITDMIMDFMYKNKIYKNSLTPMIICISLLEDTKDIFDIDTKDDEEEFRFGHDYAVSDQCGGLIACVPCAIAKPRGHNVAYSMQNGISLMALHQHLQSQDHINSENASYKVVDDE
jgi:hypothetical protein